MTDAEVKAVVAYLRTVPPIVNEVPEHQPPTVVAPTTWGKLKSTHKSE
jgi:hypothetical protein